MVKFAYTILYVQDVTKSIEFYEKAFNLARKFITPENHYGELSVSETTLSFASIEFAQNNFSEKFSVSNLKDKPFGIEIGFTTENVEETFESAIKAGAIVLEKPKAKPWGQIVGYLRDIDGFLVEVCTPM